jgi:putative membrane protein
MKKLFALPLLPMTGLIASCGPGAYGPPGPGGGWGPMMHYGFGYGYGGMFMWIVFLIVLGLLVYFIVQSRQGRGPLSSQQESPMDILKRRYAKGEITREDFERMKKDLED